MWHDKRFSRKSEREDVRERESEDVCEILCIQLYVSTTYRRIHSMDFHGFVGCHIRQWPLSTGRLLTRE